MRFLKSSESLELALAAVLFGMAAFGHWQAIAVATPCFAAFAWFSRSRSAVLCGCVASAGALLLWQALWPWFWTSAPPLRIDGISVQLLTPSLALPPLAVLAVARPRLAAAAALTLVVLAAACCRSLSDCAAVSGLQPSRMADILFIGRCAVLLACFTAAFFSAWGRAARPGAAASALVLGAASSLLAAAVLVFPQAHGEKQGHGSGRVAFWCDGFHTGRFARIRESPHGLANVGLFGEVPELLNSIGFRVGAVASLDALSCRDWDVLFLLTPPRAMTPAEYAAVSKFVESGGNLVVAAEHTDMDSNAAVYNPLLSEYGIVIGFDTTGGLCGDTIAGTVAAPGALGRLLRETPFLAYNRGASLDLRGRGARPVLLGEWWWSDMGDAGAVDRAKMGDDLLSHGDAFGWRILVAYGRNAEGGHVVVFADTSPFINRNAPYNAGFIAGLFGLLAGKSVDPAQASRRQLYISTEERNCLPLQGFEADAPTGLGVAALRAGIGVRVGAWRGLREQDLLVVANPRREIDHLRLIGHVDRGGTALVCGSGANPAFASFVGSMGCSLGERPLGPVSGDVAALEAWELMVPAGIGNIRRLVAGGKCVGCVFGIGKGRLFLVCDRKFVSSRNVETDTERNEINAGFLQGVFGTGGDLPERKGD